VLTDCFENGPAVRRILKGNTQAELTKYHGSPRVWRTTRGSDRYKLGREPIEVAVQYVADQEFKLAEVIDMEPRACP